MEWAMPAGPPAAAEHHRTLAKFPSQWQYKADLAWTARYKPRWYSRNRKWVWTRSSAIAEGPRDASCQLKSCQLRRNSAETTYTTSPDQIDGMKLEI